MNYITVKLTEDQANQIVRIMDYGKPDQVYRERIGKYVWESPEDKAFSAYLTRIQTKLRKQLQNL